MNLTIDLNTIITGVAVVLLAGVVVGGLNMRETLIRVEAEFKAFRHEVARYMEAHQGD